jgi:hypothetical protein
VLDFEIAFCMADWPYRRPPRGQASLQRALNVLACYVLGKLSTNVLSMSYVQNAEGSFRAQSITPDNTLVPSPPTSAKHQTRRNTTSSGWGGRNVNPFPSISALSLPTYTLLTCYISLTVAVLYRFKTPTPRLRAVQDGGSHAESDYGTHQ